MLRTGVPGSYVSKRSSSEPNKAFPRLLALWMNSKKPRYSGKYAYERNLDADATMIFAATRSLPWC